MNKWDAWHGSIQGPEFLGLRIGLYSFFVTLSCSGLCVLAWSLSEERAFLLIGWLVGLLGFCVAFVGVAIFWKKHLWDIFKNR